MLSDTLGASLLGNLLTRKGTNRAGEDTIRTDNVFISPHPFKKLEYKSNIKMDQNLIIFIQEMIYLK